MEIEKNNSQIPGFNTIIFDPNRKIFKSHDVIPYLVSEFMKLKKNKRPKSWEEFSEWIKGELAYMYMSRCEYEIILKDWPCGKEEEKIDIYQQCMMNFEILVFIFHSTLKNKRLKLGF